MLKNMTNVDLVRKVLAGQPSETEIELADRLGAAVDEIEHLVRELKQQTAEVMRDEERP